MTDNIKILKNSKFNKILLVEDRKYVLNKISEYVIYKDNNNFKLLVDFINELYEDLKNFHSGYVFSNFIKSLFTPNEKTVCLSYEQIFFDDMKPKPSYYTAYNSKLLELSDEEFYRLINIKI